MKSILTAIALTLIPAAASATGIHTCDPVAEEAWLTEAQLTDKLTAAGWSVRRMKKDGGCWEVYGTTPEGQRVEGYFHPASGKQLLLSERGNIIFRAE